MAPTSRLVEMNLLYITALPKKGFAYLSALLYGIKTPLSREIAGPEFANFPKNGQFKIFFWQLPSSLLYYGGTGV